MLSKWICEEISDRLVTIMNIYSNRVEISRATLRYKYIGTVKFHYFSYIVLNSLRRTERESSHASEFARGRNSDNMSPFRFYDSLRDQKKKKKHNKIINKRTPSERKKIIVAVPLVSRNSHSHAELLVQTIYLHAFFTLTETSNALPWHIVVKSLKR